MEQVFLGRAIVKTSNVSGEVPTIPEGNDPRFWRKTDIYEGELFLNTADSKLFIRSGDSIIPVFDVPAPILSTIGDEIFALEIGVTTPVSLIGSNFAASAEVLIEAEGDTVTVDNVVYVNENLITCDLTASGDPASYIIRVKVFNKESDPYVHYKRHKPVITNLVPDPVDYNIGGELYQNNMTLSGTGLDKLNPLSTFQIRAENYGDMTISFVEWSKGEDDYTGQLNASAESGGAKTIDVIITIDGLDSDAYELDAQEHV